jgi:hypothetical protein
MNKTEKAAEIQAMSKKLMLLREIRPNKFYELKGSVNTIYEIATEQANIKVNG